MFKKPAKPVKSDSSTKRKSDATHCSGSARVGLAPTAQHQTELMALASRETSKHKSSFTDHVLLDGLMLTNITAFAMFM